VQLSCYVMDRFAVMTNNFRGKKLRIEVIQTNTAQFSICRFSGMKGKGDVVGPLVVFVGRKKKRG